MRETVADETVRVFEVVLRDGLQNESVIVNTETKARWARGLVDAGCRDLEVTSFVHPRAVPQLADASELFGMLPATNGVRYWALVPNLRGLERAMSAGARYVGAFMSSSESHNQSNLNRTVGESLGEVSRLVSAANSAGVVVRAYLSTVFGCSVEGRVPIERTVGIAGKMLSFGADHVVLGDTAGLADPPLIRATLRAVFDSGIAPERVALHLHGTGGMAVVNAFVAFEMGIRKFDGCVGSLGGCPFAPGAPGNVATEDLVHMFERLGCKTGIQMDRLRDLSEEMSGVLTRDVVTSMRARSA